MKITLVPHLKYASDEDLKQVGLSKPEIRRLRKFYEKYYPHGYLSKIKRLLQNPAGKREEVGVSSFFHSLSFARSFTLFWCFFFTCSHFNLRITNLSRLSITIFWYKTKKKGCKKKSSLSLNESENCLCCNPFVCALET